MDERKIAVLRAIVEDYVQTHEPVGSKNLAERHALGVSSATIRNDMAALEEEGLISAPHTSAGRIPTDKGYRLFVDRLSSVKPMSQAEKRAISTFLDGAADLDEVMSQTVRLLAALTRQVAIVQYPSLVRTAVRHIELVSLGSSRIMLVLIADTGRVEQRVVDVAAPISEETLVTLRERLNSVVAGQLMQDVAEKVADIADQFAPEQRSFVQSVVSTLLETVVSRNEERVVVGGTANLARVRDDFGLTVAPVLEALEEQVVLLKLFSDPIVGDDLSVRIGHEHAVEGLRTSSLVTTNYGPAGASVAQLGVLGPTHMDYASSMGAVRSVARYVGQILMEQ